MTNQSAVLCDSVNVAFSDWRDSLRAIETVTMFDRTKTHDYRGLEAGESAWSGFHFAVSPSAGSNYTDRIAHQDDDALTDIRKRRTWMNGWLSSERDRLCRNAHARGQRACRYGWLTKTAAVNPWSGEVEIGDDSLVVASAWAQGFKDQSQYRPFSQADPAPRLRARYCRSYENGQKAAVHARSAAPSDTKACLPFHVSDFGQSRSSRLDFVGWWDGFADVCLQDQGKRLASIDVTAYLTEEMVRDGVDLAAMPFDFVWKCPRPDGSWIWCSVSDAALGPFG